MSDIVERLRVVADETKQGFIIEAADEIERLRAQVENQKAQIEGRHQYVGQDYEFRLERLRAENAALREELRVTRATLDSYQKGRGNFSNNPWR